MIFLQDTDCLGIAQFVGSEQILGLFLLLLQGGPKCEGLEVHNESPLRYANKILHK
jgi:hypothetical protein